MRVRLALILVALLLAAAGCAGKLGPIAMNLPGFHKISNMSGLGDTPEEQITHVLDDVRTGMETRQIYKVLAHVSRNYYDEEGRDYAAIEAYLTEVFKDYRAIHVTRVVPRIAVNGDSARAVETFGTVAEPQANSSIPPINLQGQVSVNLEKVDGKWQIVEWANIL